MEPAHATGSAALPSLEERQALFNLMLGYQTSQAIYAATRLGVADFLAGGPQTTEDLAWMTGAHPPALYRLLRFLARRGLFQEVEPGRFALTPLGAGLRSDIPGSVRPMTLLVMNEPHWRAWGHLLHSVLTGEPAFDHVHGVSFFDYLARHPDDARIFHAAMSTGATRSGAALADVYDFRGIQRLVDVGGGHGALLASVLAAHPTMQGVLFDLPEVAAAGAATLAEAGVADRCEIVGGDFFAAVPAGGDAYLLQSIIHDWDDARAVTILQNCRRVMAEGSSRLLVIEERITDDSPLGFDLEMLVQLGGSNRTDEEYRALFAATGFTLTRIIPLAAGSTMCIFEGVPG